MLIKNYEKELYQTNAHSLKQVSTSISTQMESIESISYDILCNDSIQNSLIQLRSSVSDSRRSYLCRTIYQSFYDYYFSNDYIQEIHLIPDEETDICMGSSSLLEEFDGKSLSSSIQDSPGQAVWEPSSHSGSMVVCARQIRQIYMLELNKLADLYIIVDMEKMILDSLEHCGFASVGNDFMLFLDGHQICPASTDIGNQVSDIMNTLEQSSESYCISSIGGVKKFIINGTLSGTGWDYLYLREYDSIFGQVQLVKIQTTLLMIGFGGLTVFLLALLFKRILIHLDFLIQKIQAFGNGRTLSSKAAFYDYSTRGDEIGELHRSFDQMTHSVKILRDENYEKQLLLKDAQLKMLKQLIIPHFLYNTLDTINCMAQMQGMDDISHMVCCLANVFRASTSCKDDLILLSEELKILDNYIEIQRIRFKERLDFRLSAEPECLSIRIPAFCIQPLVENALKHAMEESFEPCLIQVRITKEGNFCQIEVSNTNSRFDDDLLWKLEHHEVTSTTSGIGLSNIYSRLNLLYGNKDSITFRNSDDRAIVTLQIPL